MVFKRKSTFETEFKQLLIKSKKEMFGKKISVANAGFVGFVSVSGFAETLFYKVCILFTPRLVETKNPQKERLIETIQYNL